MLFGCMMSAYLSNFSLESSLMVSVHLEDQRRDSRIHWKPLLNRLTSTLHPSKHLHVTVPPGAKLLTGAANGLKPNAQQKLNARESKGNLGLPVLPQMFLRLWSALSVREHSVPILALSATSELIRVKSRSSSLAMDEQQQIRGFIVI